MRERHKGRLTYANVMSTIAVFGMLATGSAFAASQIGTKDIKNGAVTASKLHQSAVSTQKIKNGRFTGAKVAEPNAHRRQHHCVIARIGAIRQPREQRG